MPDLPIPVEIPWQLVGTTQPLEGSLPPNRSTLSIFAYVPDLPSLATDYPDDRIVYLKFSLSISPEFPAFVSTSARLWSTDFAPIWHVLLDVRITPKTPGGSSEHPFFLDASPLRRTMRETGTLGNDVYEGVSDNLSIGKSGTQLRESFRTDTGTAASSWSFGPLGGTTSAAGISGERNVVQTVDTTSRDASQERRELSSHSTNVENIFSLLNALYPGTPYLRFSLWPQPLHSLTADPTNESQWYAELLRRRSSGIEGVQEFYAVAAVPRTPGEFCIHTTLRRFVFGEPALPEIGDVGMPDVLSDADRVRLLAYLNQVYPRGTPLDSLDVDLVSNVKYSRYQMRHSDDGSGLRNPEQGIVFDEVSVPLADLRPAVAGWSFADQDSPYYAYNDTLVGHGRDDHVVAVSYYLAVVQRDLIATAAAAVDSAVTGVPIIALDIDQPDFDKAVRRVVYKTTAEVWREMRLAEYHAELLKSPLERGKAIVLTTEFERCLQVDGGGKVTVFGTPAAANSAASVQYTAPPRPPSRALQAIGAANFRAATESWNLAVSSLTAQAAAQRAELSPVRLSDDDVVQQYLVSVRARGKADPGNELLQQIQWLELPPEFRARLAALSISDLYDLAGALLFAVPIANMRARDAAVPARATEQVPADLRPRPSRPHEATNRIDAALVWLRRRLQTLRTGIPPVEEYTLRPPQGAAPAPVPTTPPRPPALTVDEVGRLRRAVGAGLEAQFGARAE